MTKRSVTFDAKKSSGGLVLMQQWISGQDDDGALKFDLVCGAGVGNQFMRLTVEKGGKRITEVVDIRDGLQQWVQRIERELDGS